MREAQTGLHLDTAETVPRTGFFNSRRVHFMRTLLVHAGKQGRRVVVAFIATAFALEDASSASIQWR